MYVLTRSEHITETLYLKNKDGSVEAQIDVAVDIDTIAAEYIKKQEALIAAQRNLKNKQRIRNRESFEKAYQVYTRAITDLCEVVLGRENTTKILKFYENRYVEMLMQVIPFINERFTPAIYRSISERKNQLKKLNKRRFHGISVL